MRPETAKILRQGKSPLDYWCDALTFRYVSRALPELGARIAASDEHKQRDSKRSHSPDFITVWRICRSSGHQIHRQSSYYWLRGDTKPIFRFEHISSHRGNTAFRPREGGTRRTEQAAGSGKRMRGRLAPHTIFACQLPTRLWPPPAPPRFGSVWSPALRTERSKSKWRGQQLGILEHTRDCRSPGTPPS